MVCNAKRMAESYLGGEVNGTVITVPSQFTDAQRQATRNAAAIAGFTRVDFINEPSAAAAAYVYEHSSYKGNMMVFSLGGGTLDVSVLKIDEGIIEVKSTAGDPHLGGEEFTNRIVDHLVQEFQTRHGRDISLDKRAVAKLRRACEKSKRALSVSSSASVEVDALHEDTDFYTTLTREKFESLNVDLFEMIMSHVGRVMADSKINMTDIRDILVVGGSSRIPKVKQMLTSFFNGKTLCSAINAEEAAVCGAAVKAAMFAGNQTVNLLVLDVIPFAVGLEGVSAPLIKKLTTHPYAARQIITTYADGQTDMTIRFFERNGADPASNNNLLGTFLLSGITPEPRGKPEIEVKCEYDESGLFRITQVKDAKHMGPPIRVTRTDENQLSPQDIDRLTREERWMVSEDERHRKRLEMKNDVEAYVFEVRDAVEGKAGMEGNRRVSYLLSKCNEVLSWLEDNDDADVERLKEMKGELERVFQSVMW